MPRPADYSTTEHMTPTHPDPYLRPAFSASNRMRRLVWNTAWMLLCRWTPAPLHAWRAAVLRLFGAKMGSDCHVYGSARVWAPWNLVCEDHVAIGPGAEVYNPCTIELRSHVILSQNSYVCGATHDDNDPAFPLLGYRMTLEAYAWICARAAVGPGVRVGQGAVLGLQSVATRDLEPWTVYGGSPAVKLRDRRRTAGDIE